MAKKREARGFTWPWLVTAWMMPFLIGALIAFAYVLHLKSHHEERADAVSLRWQGLNDAHNALKQDIDRVVKLSGYGLFNPKKEDIPIEELPATEGNDPPRPIQEKWKRFQQEAINGDGGFNANIAEMRAELAALKEWRVKVLDPELAHKLYNHRYTVERVIDPDSDAGRRALANLVRPGVHDATSGDVRPETKDLEEALRNYRTGTPPDDSRLARIGLGRITLEDIVRLQNELLALLADETKLQHMLLYGEVDGWKEISDAGVAFGTNVENASSNMRSEKAACETRMTELSRTVEGVKSGYSGIRERAGLLTESKVRDLGGRITTIGLEVDAHVADARQFQALLQANKKIADQHPLLKHEIDAKITMVDRSSGLVHIDLGSDDGAHAGQRFEVHQLTGQGPQYLKGVIEVIRPISSYYSLAVVLDVVGQGDAAIIREGDACISKIWHNGRYLSVALHGKEWNPPHTKYGKFRLEQMLRDIGVTVHDKVGPSTDLVIASTGLIFDSHHFKVRNRLRFDQVNEEAIRLYVDPR